MSLKNTDAVSNIKDTAQDEFIQLFYSLDKSHGIFENWQDFITLSACSISNAFVGNSLDEREAMFKNTVEKHSAEDFSTFAKMLSVTESALSDNPNQDFLGAVYMAMNIGEKVKGQFFTPYHVCEAAARAQMKTASLIDTIKGEKGRFTVNDDCCGGGALLIAAANEAAHMLKETGYDWHDHIILYGRDLDQTTAMTCYIQLSAIGAAAVIRTGDCLSEPVPSEASKKSSWITPQFNFLHKRSKRERKGKK